MQKPEVGHRSPMHQRLAPLVQRLASPDPILQRLPASVRIYCVGGAVRDALLGEPNSDRDYVVIGARVDDMLAAGFTAVGKDFPVFLHPKTHEEFALARTERKSGKGYKGFVFQADPAVRLEDDLGRRDFTINAIAVSPDGELIDPYHGIEDLQQGILRHVGPAFSEDPVRLLRLARFASRWPGFSIAHETLLLCREIVASGEARALVPERLWQEISKGLMESRPSRMIELLIETQAWSVLADNNPIVCPTTCQALDEAAKKASPLEVRFALLMRNIGNSPLPASLFKAPKSCQELAAVFLSQSKGIRPAFDALSSRSERAVELLLDWLLATDVLRRPDRFESLIACLLLAKDIDADEATLLVDWAAFLGAASAQESVAHAVQEAASKGRPAAAAAHSARLDALWAHPVFSSLSRSTMPDDPQPQSPH